MAVSILIQIALYLLLTKQAASEVTLLFFLYRTHVRQQQFNIAQRGIMKVI